MQINKIIVSHKRATQMTTHKAVSGCKVCVPESQLDEYKKANPDLEYLVHPDSIIGLSPKRQWIYETVGDCFQLDDDIASFNRVYIPNQNRYATKLTPEEASGLIDDVYNIAKDNGFYLFGFNRSSHPKAFNGHEPILLNGFITGGAFGLISGSKIFFPNYPHFVGEDYFLNAINLYFHRYCYIERRFAVSFNDTEHGKGGVADYRTEEKRKETYIYLKKMFGDIIKPKIKNNIKKNLNKWEKSIVFPF